MKKINLCFAAILFLCFLHVNVWGDEKKESVKISKIEIEILKSVNKLYNESLESLEKIVNINSGTMNHEGVRKVGKVLEEKLINAGFSTQWISMPEKMKRAGHLYGEIKGSKGKKILLIGHLDTVFSKNSKFQKFEMDGSKAIGPGVIDMKGGNLVMVYALLALKENGLLKDKTIRIIFSGDEESSGNPKSLSKKDLIESAKKSDIALAFEPGTKDLRKVSIARRGNSKWTLKTKGKQGHSGQIFSEKYGSGAIFEISRILFQFHEGLKNIDGLTFNPGTIIGGNNIKWKTGKNKGTASGKTNVIAKTARVSGDLRFLNNEDKEKAREIMKKIVSNNLPGTSAELIFKDGYPPMAESTANIELFNELNRINLDLGHGKIEKRDPGKRGAADVSWVAEYVACMDGLGPDGGNAHSPEEYINLNSFKTATERAALLIYRLLNKK